MTLLDDQGQTGRESLGMEKNTKDNVAPTTVVQCRGIPETSASLYYTAAYRCSHTLRQQAFLVVQNSYFSYF